jgi:hypothetical protein
VQEFELNRVIAGSVQQRLVEGVAVAALFAPCVYWKMVVSSVSSVRGAFSVSSLRFAQKGFNGSKAALMPST